MCARVMKKGGVSLHIGGIQSDKAIIQMMLQHSLCFSMFMSVFSLEAVKQKTYFYFSVVVPINSQEVEET